jgi:hypothetical protein
MPLINTAPMMPARKMKLWDAHQSQWRFIGFIRRDTPGFLSEVIQIQKKIDHQQQPDEGQHVGHDFKGPEKGDAVQKPQKERRVSQRGQRATDVGDQKNEKNHHEGTVLPVIVGPQKGTDQQHGCPGGAHPRGQQGAQRQNDHIDHRRTPKRSLQKDAAGYGIQGPQQNNKGHIVSQQNMDNFIQGGALVCIEERTGHRRRPECGHLAEMMVPELRRQQRKQGDRKQHAGKGKATPKRQNRAQVQMAVVAPLICKAMPRFRVVVRLWILDGAKHVLVVAGKGLIRFGRPKHGPLDGHGKKKNDGPQHEKDQASAGYAHGLSGLPVEKQVQSND